MGTSAKSPRYRWKEEREMHLRDYVDSRVREGVSITQALKEYGQKNRMSWLTARWKYYQVRNQKSDGKRAEVAEAAAAPSEAAPLSTVRDDDFLSYLRDLVLATEESGQDIVPFIKGFSRMAVLSRESMRHREEVFRLKEQLRSVREAIESHSRNLSEWLLKTQVDRVSCLKEFSDLMARDLAVLEDLRENLGDA
ncbi:MAG: hypothetical protein ACOX5M_03775 [Bacillota bacterium]